MWSCPMVAPGMEQLGIQALASVGPFAGQPLLTIRLTVALIELHHDLIETACGSPPRQSFMEKGVIGMLLGQWAVGKVSHRPPKLAIQCAVLIDELAGEGTQPEGFHVPQ